MMNSEADGQYIALKGRVPVKVEGPVKKGQAVFGISLGPVHTETEAEILSLYPDKVSAANR